MAGCSGSGNEAGHAASKLRGGLGMNRGAVGEFQAFILRGNVLDLAVAVVIGAAFGAIVTSLVENIITPIIAAIGGQPDFSTLTFTLNSSEVRYGAFLNSVISFLNHRPHHQANECAHGLSQPVGHGGGARDMSGMLQPDFSRRQPVPELHYLAARTERARLLVAR
jgi:hypothetical protein